jgi:peptidoglycan/xylan/chitin deacetylase (PgdA/CDA1 family)
LKAALIEAIGVTSWMLGRLLSQGRLTVLTYHSVTSAYDPLASFEQITAATFREQMSLVSRHFTVLPLMEAIEHLQRGTLPANALAITFDDGYLNNHDVALPILKSLGLTATFFVSTGYMEGGLMFNDLIMEALRRTRKDDFVVPTEVDPSGRLELQNAPGRVKAFKRLAAYAKYLPDSERAAFCLETWRSLVPSNAAEMPRLMMSAEHVRNLHQQGMTIGGHSHSHPIFTSCSLDKVREEVILNRDTLHNLIGEPPEVFAYPNGRANRDYTLAHARLLEEAGYRCAVTTEIGVCCPGMDLYQLPRYMPWTMTPGKLLYHLSRNAITGTSPITATA